MKILYNAVKKLRELTYQCDRVCTSGMCGFYDCEDYDNNIYIYIYII